MACDEHALLDLLADLDRLGWEDPEGAAVLLERHAVGTGVAGGMGGAIVADGPWLHPELDVPELAEQVADVLAGRRERVDLDRGAELVWRTGPPWAQEPPARLGLAAPAHSLLEGLLEVLAAAPSVDGELEVLGLGRLRLDLPHPDGGAVRLLAGPEGARLAFEGLPGEAEVDVEPDVIAFDQLADLVGALVVRGVAVRRVRWADEGEAVVVAGEHDDGSPMTGRWDLEPWEVDWLTAELGPVERIGPLRRGG